MMGRNQRHPAGRRGSKLKARIGIATAVVVGGSAIGAVAMATTSHPSATKAESAGYSSSYSNWSNQGNVLNAGLSDYSWSQSRAMTMFSHLSNSNHLTQMWHHHSMLAFERGRVVLATKKFVLVRSASGRLNVWWLSHGTKVINVASSMTGTTAMTGSRRAAAAAMAGQMTPATAMMTGSSMAAQQMLAPTAPTATVKIVGTGITISVTVTNNMAMVWQNMQNSGMWWRQPATMAVAGLQRGELVFIAGTRADWALHAKVILIEKAATTTPTVTPSMTMTPTATPSMTMTPTAPATMGATPTPSATTSVAPGSGGTHS